MSKNNRPITISDFYCTRCGNKGISLPRKISREREPGHLKEIWCPYCNMKTNHVEVRPFGSYTVEDFKEEFELGRFIEGKRLSLQELMECSNINCKYNKNRKCWNSNYSYDCKYRLKENNLK